MPTPRTTLLLGAFYVVLPLGAKVCEIVRVDIGVTGVKYDENGVVGGCIPSQRA
jgi:hypothetical protein